MRKRSGFTLVELTIAVVILFFLFWFMSGLLIRPENRAQARRAACASNQKRIALAFLEYAQDYDDRFPPVASYDKRGQLHYWSPDRVLPDGHTIVGLLSSYTKSNALFYDPEVYLPDSPAHLCYMYNDLLATQKQDEVTSVMNTVLLVDAEDCPENAGHALTPNRVPFAAIFNRQGKCSSGQGASIGTARTRHLHGANFTFADGHVKWFKGGPEDQIFFPSRDSSSISAFDEKTKLQLGPLPGEKMNFGGKRYQGTFHLH